VQKNAFRYCFSFEGSETYSFLWKRKVSEKLKLIFIYE